MDKHRSKKSQSTNVRQHSSDLTNGERKQALGQSGVAVWLTGLSGSGKSTLAMAVERALVLEGFFAAVLDGDNLRHGLCGDLGFTVEDRAENIRRVGEVAGLFVDAGAIVLCAFVSPSREVRAQVRSRFSADTFIEVYVSTALSVCESRDPKGLYVRARSGEIGDFTGISAPYEPPNNPELTVNTDGRPLEECVAELMELIRAHQDRWRSA